MFSTATKCNRKDVSHSAFVAMPMSQLPVNRSLHIDQTITRWELWRAKESYVWGFLTNKWMYVPASISPDFRHDAEIEINSRSTESRLEHIRFR